MEEVHKNCFNAINEGCSKNAHIKLGLDWPTTQSCVSNSFTSTQWSNPNTNNTLIDEDITYWKKYGSGVFPSIVINNKTYRGQMEEVAVMNALCAGFATPPEMCKGLLNSLSPDYLLENSKGIRGGVIFVLVVGLILLNIVIVYCYRRYTRREIQSEMNT